MHARMTRWEGDTLGNSNYLNIVKLPKIGVGLPWQTKLSLPPSPPPPWGKLFRFALVKVNKCSSSSNI